MQLVTVAKNLQSDKWEPSGHLKKDYYHSLLIDAKYSDTTISNYLYTYDEFKNKYPDLKSWFNEDIITRVSDVQERNVCYRARVYIIAMVINGLELDYEYLFSLSGTDGYKRLSDRLGLDIGFDKLKDEALKLGYSSYSADQALKWAYIRIIMHKAYADYTQITDNDLIEFKEAARKYLASDISKIFYPDTDSLHNKMDRFSTSEYTLHLCLHSLRVVSSEAQKEHSRSRKYDRNMSHLSNRAIADTIVRYINQSSRLKEPGTIQSSFRSINKFVMWLEKQHPETANLSEINRQIIEEYMLDLKENGSDKFGKPYSVCALTNYISALKVFFDESLSWEYEDVPQKKVLFDYDLPKKPKSLPRYIPQPDLDKLMSAIYKLEDVYQRNALILTRWTGARREEIQRLDINALDHYADGTPRIRIPIGKTNRDRWVPINQEAENAYNELLSIRSTANNTRGLIDRKTKKETDYLFMKGNRRISTTYLFQQGLEAACIKADLLTQDGKPKYTAHQFRHTIGTTLANNGASLQTIMKVLGHESPEMSLVYSTIFDSTVKEEYENAVLQNQTIAGGDFAISIKNHELKEDEIDWIKANFHKTYLMTGHCFHHTKEPMCDFADACFFCAKYVASKENIPVLLDKYHVELQLIEDAIERGWDKEVSRHEKVASRVKEILLELGESV